MLIRLTLFALAGWLLIRWLWPKLRPPPPNKPTGSAYTEMLPCAWCHTHIARDAAHFQQGQYYCCREHAQAALDRSQNN